MTEWIKFKDYSPNDYDLCYHWVLVCRLAKCTVEPTFISIATYRGDEWFFDSPNGGTSYYSDLRSFLEGNEITHWAKLPKPPKSDNANYVG